MSLLLCPCCVAPLPLAEVRCRSWREQSRRAELWQVLFESLWATLAPSAQQLLAAHAHPASLPEERLGGSLFFFLSWWKRVGVAGEAASGYS